jgi:tRNA uridine 5-carboxymethylaminomethyl modification enzyme
LIEIVKRPQVSLKDINLIVVDFQNLLSRIDLNIDKLLERIEIEIKYNGYIDREKIVAEKINRLDKIKIHENINYDELKSISIEGRQKLKAISPQTIGQASRISGVSPADINVLLVYIGR